MIYITIIFIVSIIGINIRDIIANALIKLNPVLNDKIHILLISKLYLQIFYILFFLLLIV